MTTTPKPALGSKNWLQADFFRQESSTVEVSCTSPQTISEATTSVTSSPESEAGRAHCNSQDGLTPDLFGPEAAHVSRFRARDSAKAMPTNDTCGPLFTSSSPSAGLQQSLESRLRERLGVNGSPEYELTWKEQDMPAGVPICALRASGRRTSGNDSSGWPTPCQQDGPKGGPNQGEDRLPGAAQLAGWATPAGRDWKDTPGMATPTVNDATGSQHAYSQGRHDKIVLKLPGQASGAIAPSSPAGTEKRGALNPAFSLWLMGYPAEWASCGERAMQSCRRSPQNSSKPT